MNDSPSSFDDPPSVVEPPPQVTIDDISPIEPPTEETPQPSAKPDPYEGSQSYLNDELHRVEYWLRAYLLRRKSAMLSRRQSPSGFPDASQAVLRAGYRWNDPLTNPECAEEEGKALAAVDRWEKYVKQRLSMTDPPVRRQLRLWQLSGKYALIPNQTQIVVDPKRERKTLLLDIILLALLVERSPRYREAIGALRIAEGETSRGLTVESTLEILRSTDQRPVLAESSVLLQQQLVRRDENDAISLDPRIADYLLDVEGPEPNEPVRVAPATRGPLGVDAETRTRVAALARWWKQNLDRNNLVVLCNGSYGSPMIAAAQQFLLMASPSGKVPLLLADAAVAPTGDVFRPFVRRVYREALLRNGVVFWQNAETILAEAGGIRWQALVAEAERCEHPSFIATETAWDPVQAFHDPKSRFVRVEFPVPSTATRREIWERRLEREQPPLQLPPTPEWHAALDLLASFQFTEGQIDDALATARGLFLAPPALGGLGDPIIEVYYEACRRQSGRRLVAMAQRVQPRPDHHVAERDKEAELQRRVVLSPAAERHLIELFRRMRHLTTVYHTLGFEHRLSLGRGLIALFTGPSGTGKTYAASTLAGLLQKDLYKVDMAAVVSKFVGETEKNLSRVFADAQDANAVLFFDEADALFGKRGDVQQAQDRWANLEVNYLLQRVEEYTGTVILATNHRQNIDEAFLRRVQMMIEFDRPKEEARLKILEGLFRGTQVPAPDHESMMSIARKFDLTGGNLKNVVLDATFRAVSENADVRDVRVELRHLVLGVAREYQKLGKPIATDLFGKQWMQWVREDLQLPV